MNKLRVAIVGCGNVSKRHFEAAFQNENSVLVACCDNVPKKADDMAEKYNIKAYYLFDEMMNDADFDVLHMVKVTGRSSYGKRRVLEFCPPLDGTQ